MKFDKLYFLRHGGHVFPDGVVVGARALGCERDETGRWVDKQQGGHGVVVERNSEIGANSVVHCGSWRQTRIGAGARIGALVNIGHNVVIGKNVLIAPFSSIGGSVEIGDNVTIWMGAMIAQHLKIGDGAVIGMGAVVMKDVPAGATVWGNPARVVRVEIPDTAAGFEREGEGYVGC